MLAGQVLSPLEPLCQPPNLTLKRKGKKYIIKKQFQWESTDGGLSNLRTPVSNFQMKVG
jgi:hypothetical protein